MRYLDFNARFDGHDKPLEVDCTILFDRLDGSSSGPETRVFRFYGVDVTATVGTEDANSGEILYFPLENFDFLRRLRFRLALFYLRLDIRGLLYEL